ncbi:recombination protein NinB [Methylobacterium sp. SD274]|uniref:recombination protein NinB n=1 Tax=Methylobacterium sp. SD274 TaxID=2782009 RepID=UPI001A96DD98|nr:recombination protein NinB [Methylobacterium sp. SD274]MBO1021492.1 recombination protein NinB [Methylobacterium sp. SD274]
MNGSTLFLTADHVRERAATWIRNAPHGTRVEFREAKRSDEQNRKLWAALSDVSRQVEWYGASLSPDDWKDIFTASLRKARVVPGIDAGTVVPLGMRTSAMTKAEFSDLLELIHAFGAERGVVFGDGEG